MNREEMDKDLEVICDRIKKLNNRHRLELLDHLVKLWNADGTLSDHAGLFKEVLRTRRYLLKAAIKEAA